MVKNERLKKRMKDKNSNESTEIEHSPKNNNKTQSLHLIMSQQIESLNTLCNNHSQSFHTFLDHSNNNNNNNNHNIRSQSNLNLKTLNAASNNYWMSMPPLILNNNDKNDNNNDNDNENNNTSDNDNDEQEIWNQFSHGQTSLTNTNTHTHTLSLSLSLFFLCVFFYFLFFLRNCVKTFIARFSLLLGTIYPT